MATDIDSLQININANATKANDALDKLVNKINKLTTSLSSIDGSKLNGLASGVQQLGTAMQSVNSKNINAISRLSENITKLSTVNISGLEKVASSLPSIASEFNKIGEISVDAQKFTELANGISRLGNKSANNAITNIPKLATAMKQLMKELSKAPKVNQNLIDTTNALAKLARTGASSGKAAQSLSNSFTGIYKSSGFAVSGIKKVNARLVSLIRSIAPVVGLVKLIDFGKQAMEISSDLTEVQNVVDATFGNYKQKIEDLASVSIPELGMSELSVKEIGSRFQAIGTAMGFSTEKMSDMSVELTRLTGDMGSFYNVEQEDMGKALQSIFTGETEPMRKYGIDLTNATIQQYALSQGISTSVNNMTQLEKAQLRYNYVMAQTTAAQGDFLRTQDTWANQIRILKENLKQLASIIGSSLINAFKPLIQALNSAMSHIISFAQTVSNALGKIFGWKFEVGGGGITNDLETGAGAADDIANSTGTAAKNVEKIQKGLRGFDELKVITMPTDGTSGSTGGGSSAGTGTASGGEWVQQSSIFEDFKSEISSLFELGEYIGKTLTDAMNSIEWESIYEKARGFGTGLAEFLNGLISPELFGAVGRTIASALNTAIYTALAFGKTFDWKNLGESIAAGINDFFATFDFEDFANTIDVWVQGIWTTIKTAFLDIKWEDVWNGAKSFFTSLDVETVEIIIGAVLIKKILGLHLAKTALSIIGTSISRSIAQAIASKLGVEIAANAGIKEALTAGLGKAFSGTFFLGVAKGITGVGGIIGGATLSVTNFFSMWENGFDWLKEALMVLGTAIAAVGAVILGAPAAVAAAVAGIVAAIGTIAVVVHDNWDAICDWFSGVGDWFDTNVIQPVAGLFQGLWETVSGFFSNLWEDIVSIWDNVSTWFSENVIEPVVGFFVGLATRVQQIFEGLWIIIQAVWKVVSDWFNNNVIIPVTNFFKGLWDSVLEIFTSLWNGIKSVWNNVAGWFSKTIITPVSNAFKTACDKIGGFFTSLWSGIKKGVASAMNAVIGAIEKALNWLVSGINAIIGGFNKVVSWAASIIEVDWGGVSLVPKVSLGRINVSGFENGGFPKQYSMFMAGENGVPEMLGTVGGKTAVAGGTEITGISDTIRATSNEEVVLLRQQNALLQAILEKEYGISKDDIGKAAQSWARDYSRRTGREAYSF